MEETGKTPQRRLQRKFECGRFEDQLWALAYEQIWPVLRTGLKRAAGLGRQAPQSRREHAADMARRA